MFRSADLGINGRFSSQRCLNYGNLYLAINTEEEAKITITAFIDAGVCVGHQRDNEDETFLADGFLVSVTIGKIINHNFSLFVDRESGTKFSIGNHFLC